METSLNPQRQPEEEILEKSLRPRVLSEFVGQTHLKDNLTVFVQAAKKRQKPLDHVLIYGPPGLGKTTLAYVIANEMGRPIRVTSGPALERPGDLASILSGLEEGEVFFVDEFHRLNRLVEEILYPAMEEFSLDLVLGKGPSAKTLRLDLPHFTLVGATTRMSLISSPLRDRFGQVFQLDFYTPSEIEKILVRSAKILEIPLQKEATKEVALRSRRTPRVANRLLKRIRDFAEVHNKGIVDQKLAQLALEKLEVDPRGLDRTDRKILSTIIDKYGGGPVGIETIAASTAEERETLEEVYEPYLLREGLIERTPRGRKTTSLAHAHLNKHKPHTLFP